MVGTNESGEYSLDKSPEWSEVFNELMESIAPYVRGYSVASMYGVIFCGKDL